MMGELDRKLDKVICVDRSEGACRATLSIAPCFRAQRMRNIGTGSLHLSGCNWALLCACCPALRHCLLMCASSGRRGRRRASANIKSVRDCIDWHCSPGFFFFFFFLAFLCQPGALLRQRFPSLSPMTHALGTAFPPPPPPSHHLPSPLLLLRILTSVIFM